MEEIPQQGNYRSEDLFGYSDTEIIGLLKSVWGYSANVPIDVIGQLRKITPKHNSKPFYLLENLHSIHDGQVLLYPIDDFNLNHTAFVGGLHHSKEDNGLVESAWIKARVDLSPIEQRKQRNNPFALKVHQEGMSRLHRIPKEIAYQGLKASDSDFIEQWVWDFYHNKQNKLLHDENERHDAELKSKHQKLQNDLNEESKALAELRDKLSKETSQLSNEVESYREGISLAEASLVEKKEAFNNFQAEFKQRKLTMERQLNTLNNFIQNQAELLVQLDLLSQNEADKILGRSEQSEQLVGHDFNQQFSAQPSKFIGYVQSYLYSKGIIYRRDVLENFYALLCTHDLIVLAGDSGSGKTNLVKSFAKAIGGKAVIVPVKPNWTSSEDLIGYYNPIEQKYLSTPFLEAIFEAQHHPEIPYLICLDEMNLSRVEYYFADFLSLLEERGSTPEIPLYSDAEASNLLSETKNFLALIDDAKEKLDKPDLQSFLDLLKDEDINAKLHESCGFKDGESLLTYHARLRRLVGSYLKVPSSIQLPENVRIVGAINVDETTHYLSPKILDRAHVMRFSSPLLTDWDEVESEIQTWDLDIEQPVIMQSEALGQRLEYPDFDRSSPLVRELIYLSKEFLNPLGVEFGMRTVRQASNYENAMKGFVVNNEVILNNIILHKVLPKLMFDGEKLINENVAKKDCLMAMRNYLSERLASLDVNEESSCLAEIDRVIRNAQSNDWVVNYWSR